MKINLMLPGREFTQRNVRSLLDLLKAFDADPDIQYETFWHYSSDIYGCRTGILQTNAGDLKAAKVPFNGAEYDYMMWIDSDVQYKPRDVYQLIEDDKDIVTGLVPIGLDERVAVGKYILSEDGKPGMAYVKGTVDWTGLAEMDFCGFAFVLIKRGVFEAIEYPWFQTVRVTYGGHDINTSEDVGFCYRAKLAGFQVWADPRVRVGHEKPLVMWCGGVE